MDHPMHMRTRLAVRRALSEQLPPREGSGGGARDRVLEGAVGDDAPLVLVGLSGGADSLALAAALAAEVTALGVRAGALVVDHGLQEGSAEVAERAAAAARNLRLDPVVVRGVDVLSEGASGEGLEAAARSARYRAFQEVARSEGASMFLTAHTRDDQSEQVLLALARGSGTKSIAGIPRVRRLSSGLMVARPFLWANPEVTREVTVAACDELGLQPWHDPHNRDEIFARVRVRTRVLPLLAETLGERAVKGLARSADLAREDDDALAKWAEAVYAEIAPATDALIGDSTGVTVSAEHVQKLSGLPAAIRQRVLHMIARTRFEANLSREHTLAIAALITDWRGQGPVFVPGIRVTRLRGALEFSAQTESPRIAARRGKDPLKPSV